MLVGTEIHYREKKWIQDCDKHTQSLTYDRLHQVFINILSEP